MWYMLVVESGEDCTCSDEEWGGLCVSDGEWGGLCVSDGEGGMCVSDGEWGGLYM